MFGLHAALRKSQRHPAAVPYYSQHTLCESHMPLLLQPSVKDRCRCSHCNSNSALRSAAAAARRPTSRSQRKTTVTSASVPLATKSSSGLSERSWDRLLLPPAKCLTGPCRTQHIAACCVFHPSHVYRAGVLCAVSVCATAHEGPDYAVPAWHGS